MSNETKEDKVTNDVTFTWSQKEKKMTRIIERIEKNGKSGSEVVSTQKSVYNEIAARKLFDTLKTQKKGMQLFYDNATIAKELNEKKEELPMFKEIKNALEAMRWENDQQLKAQYEQVVGQIKAVNADLEKLEKVLPAKDK